jgi:hypothetical protein
MQPVQMNELTSAESAYRACLATVLDMSLDDVPSFDGLAADMQWAAWLGARMNLMVVTINSTYPGFWIARVRSPYPAYAVHSLVMRSGLVIHDPHPEPQPVPLDMALLSSELLAPLDPSLPCGRAALEAGS